MAAGDLTTLASFEQFKTLPSGNADEALISALITAVSAGIATICGRVFQVQPYTDQRNGTGGKILPLTQVPVTAVASVMVDGIAIPSGDPLTTAGFFFDAKRVYLNGYRFSKGLQNVSVAYTAGFAAIPADLAQACNELVALRYAERPHFDLISKAMAGETTAFVTKDMKSSTALVLDRFKRVVPAWP